MKRPFPVGLAIAVAVALATIAVKAALTKYPGVGDFMLFTFVVEFVPSRMIDGIYALGLDLRVISYLSKAALAAALYTALFFGTKKKPSLQMPVSVGVCVVVLAAMSFGEAVVA